MQSMRRRIRNFTVAAVLVTGVSLVATTDAAFAGRHPRGFNDEYIYAATRAVNDMPGTHPAVKITLFPVTFAIDTAFLPFAVLAGFIS